MNYHEFMDAVVAYFTKKLGKEYSVSVNEVIKNNSIHLNGILMKKAGQRITPNVYLNPFFEQYVEKGDFAVVVKNIWTTYCKALDSFSVEEPELELDFEVQREHIIYCLINFKKNKEKLEKMPYIRFLDLAITFHCYVQYQEYTVSLLPITNELMKHWEMDEKSLFQIAMKNTQKYFPMIYGALEDIIKTAIEEEWEPLFPAINGEMKMYVISNEQGVNGASVMLYEENFHQLALQLGGKVYVLPSSIHEIILIPYEKGIQPEQLAALVKDVNTTQVPYEDILSDHAYLYHSETRSFEVF